jgi:hypothetical protein
MSAATVARRRDPDRDVVAHAHSSRLLGGQIVGIEGAATRIDVLAAAIWSETPVGDFETRDLACAPPFSAVHDPLLIAARQTANRVEGT